MSNGKEDTEQSLIYVPIESIHETIEERIDRWNKLLEEGVYVVYALYGKECHINNRKDMIIEEVKRIKANRKMKCVYL